MFTFVRVFVPGPQQMNIRKLEIFETKWHFSCFQTIENFHAEFIILLPLPFSAT
jgi:hypothetical protein